MVNYIIQWNLSYPDTTYPDSQLTELRNDCSIRVVEELIF